MTILDEQLEAGRLYARLAVHRRRRDFALAGIEAMRQLAPNSYLSLSWGKQSIILAHMLYQLQPSLPMYFLASGESWIIHNYAEVIEQFTARWPINLRIVQTDHVFDGSNLSWTESRKRGQRDLQSMCDPAEWDGWYWGLAKHESKGRRMTLSATWDGQPHPTIYRYSGEWAAGKYRCCPLMHWGVMDIAAYVAAYDIPLLDAYHTHGLETRTTARVTGKTTYYGGVSAIKRADLEAFNRLCARFPELRART